MSFSNYLETEVLEFAFTTSGGTRPTAWFLALFTAAPSDSGGGEFPTATANYGQVGWVGVFDASSSGNLLAWAALTTAKTIETGDVFRVPSGDLDITLN